MSESINFSQFTLWQRMQIAWQILLGGEVEFWPIKGKPTVVRHMEIEHD